MNALPEAFIHLVVQCGPLAVQAEEGVVHDVFGLRLVAEHDLGELDQAKRVRLVERGDSLPRLGRNAVAWWRVHQRFHIYLHAGRAQRFQSCSHSERLQI